MRRKLTRDIHAVCDFAYTIDKLGFPADDLTDLGLASIGMCSYIGSALSLLQPKCGSLRVRCHTRYSNRLTVLDDRNRTRIFVSSELSTDLLYRIVHA
jgi:hypothetical protein